jgi:DNA-binding CsgD family transcriptional regulator
LSETTGIQLRSPQEIVRAVRLAAAGGHAKHVYRKLGVSSRGELVGVEQQ